MKLLKTLTLSIMLLAGAAQSEVLFEKAERYTDMGNNSVTYNFTGLSPHSEIFVNFDLYIMDSWDVPSRESETHKQDRFTIDANGTNVLSYRTSQEWGIYSPRNNTKPQYIFGSYNDFDNWGPIDRFYSDFSDGFVFDTVGDTFSITISATGLSPPFYTTEHGEHYRTNYPLATDKFFGFFDESWSIGNIFIATDSVAFQENISISNVSTSFPLGLLSFILLSSFRLRK